MKKPALIATIAAGVVLVGGGAWGATMLAVSDESAGVAVETVEPSVTPSAVPTADPTAEVTETATPEPVATPTPEVVETPAPVEEPERDPRAAELQAGLAGWGITTYSDADVITAADYVCSELAAGVSHYDVIALPNEGNGVNGEFVYTATYSYC